MSTEMQNAPRQGLTREWGRGKINTRALQAHCTCVENAELCFCPITSRRLGELCLAVHCHRATPPRAPRI